MIRLCCRRCPTGKSAGSGNVTMKTASNCGRGGAGGRACLLRNQRRRAFDRMHPQCSACRATACHKPSSRALHTHRGGVLLDRRVRQSASTKPALEQRLCTGEGGGDAVSCVTGKRCVVGSGKRPGCSSKAQGSSTRRPRRHSWCCCEGSAACAFSSPRFRGSQARGKCRSGTPPPAWRRRVGRVGWRLARRACWHRGQHRQHAAVQAVHAQHPPTCSAHAKPEVTSTCHLQEGGVSGQEVVVGGGWCLRGK